MTSLICPSNGLSKPSGLLSKDDLKTMELDIVLEKAELYYYNLASVFKAC